MLLDKGARAAALAGALCASPESGPFGFVYNPAGLAAQNVLAFGFEHNEWGQGMRGEYLAAASPLGSGTLAGALDYFSYGTLEVTDGNGRISGETLAPYLLGARSAYALWVRPRLAAGAQVDFYMENIGDFTELGGGLSVGAFWKSPWQGVSAGLTVRNLGLTRSGYSLPSRVILGCSWMNALVDRLALYLETGFNWVDSEAAVALAAEYQALSWLDLRLGYRPHLSMAETAPLGVTAGIGFHWQDWQLGYAVVPLGEWGWAHRLSLEMAIKPAPNLEQIPGKTAAVSSQPARKTAEDMAKQLAGVVRKRFELGLKQYQNGNYKAAIREWKMVLDIAPHHEETKEYIQKAENKWEALLDNYRQNARQARLQKDLAEEIMNWKDVLALVPGDQEAQQGLESAQKLVPAMAQAYYNAGLDDYSKGRYQEAIKNWEKVLALDPGHYKAMESIQKTKEKLIKIE
ncbi:MAG: tetratricopeptide repeat protein [candidate division FCPU426 bacterium]